MAPPERPEAAPAAPPFRARVRRMGRHTARPVGWVLLLALAESLPSIISSQPAARESASCAAMGGVASAPGAAGGLLVCCPTECGGCGGEGCELRPGGAGRCCADAIAGTGAACSSPAGAQPPCVLPAPADPGPGPTHRRRLGDPSPTDFNLAGPGISAGVVAGRTSWFTIEVVDANGATVGAEAGLATQDFQARSSLPSCRGAPRTPAPPARALVRPRAAPRSPPARSSRAPLL